MTPTIITAEAVAITTLPSATKPAINAMTPNATIQPHLAWRIFIASASVGIFGVSETDMAPPLCGMAGHRRVPVNGTLTTCVEQSMTHRPKTVAGHDRHIAKRSLAAASGDHRAAAAPVQDGRRRFSARSLH